jgi:flagellar biosynthesis/type III secretory pathway protein FliH
MKDKKETAVEYLTKEFSEILGKVTTTPLQDLLLVDAITIAKEKEKQQIIEATERLYSEKQMDDAYDKGFKDATERMYSEEEVISLLKKAHFVDQNIYEWFSQNKKKKDEQ